MVKIGGNFIVKIVMAFGAFIAGGAIASAQTQLSQPMLKAVSACQKLSSAIGAESTAGMRAAEKQLRACATADFKSLKLSSGIELSLDNHYIFDEDFAKSLIDNRKVRSFAQKYASRRADRGISARPGQVLLTTKAIAAGKKAVWTTMTRGLTEIAVVAEPKGMLTMRILDSKGRPLYTEKNAVKRGAPMRAAKIKVADKSVSHISIEITNCGASDTSFAILAL